MTNYECWSLVLTGMYDLFTFLLLVFVAYEALIKPRLPNIAFYIQRMPEDTKQWGWQRQLVDFILENRGHEIKNVLIKSEPDFVGWDNLGKENKNTGKSTSEYFKNPLPYLGQNERLQFFWCDIQANIDVLKKPFQVILEFDNPVFPFPRRLKKTFKFNFTAFDGIVFGMTGRYDIHNVAREASRIREQIENISKLAANLTAQRTRDDTDK
jgi:hypothetical protein